MKDISSIIPGVQYTILTPEREIVCLFEQIPETLDFMVCNKDYSFWEASIRENTFKYAFNSKLGLGYTFRPSAYPKNIVYTFISSCFRLFRGKSR